MTRDDAFLAAIIEAPDDDTPRLVYADWLEEQAGTVPCSAGCRIPLGSIDGLSRVHENYGPDSRWSLCDQCSGTGRVPDGRAARAEFIRIQCELAAYDREEAALYNEDTDWSECTGIAASWCPNCGDCCCANREDSMNDRGCPLHDPRSRHCCLDALHDKADALRRRERELLDDKRFVLSLLPAGWFLHWLMVPGGTFRRGFAESIACTAADWLAHGDAIVRAQPVTRVRLTTFDGESLFDLCATACRRLGLRTSDVASRGVTDTLVALWPGVTFHVTLGLPPVVVGHTVEVPAAAPFEAGQPVCLNEDGTVSPL